MMNYRLNFVALGFAALLAFPAVTQAEEDKNSRFSVEFQRDPDGKINPETYFPQKWNDNWYSGLFYKDTSSFSSDTLGGITESKIGTSIDDRRIRLNMISYSDNVGSVKYSMGVNVQRIDINKNEFGYVHLVTTTPAINSWVAIDNRVKIGVNSFALQGDMTMGGDKETPYMVRVGVIVAPVNSLSLTQETDFRPLVATTGTSSATSAQKLNWEATLETRYRATEWLSVGFDARYEVLPLKYQIAQLNSTLDGFLPTDIESTDTTTRFGIKFIVKRKDKETHPLIGIANETVNSKDEISGTSTKTSRVLFLIGLTGQF